MLNNVKRRKIVEEFDRAAKEEEESTSVPSTERAEGYRMPKRIVHLVATNHFKVQLRCWLDEHVLGNTESRPLRDIPHIDTKFNGDDAIDFFNSVTLFFKTPLQDQMFSQIVRVSENWRNTGRERNDTVFLHSTAARDVLPEVVKILKLFKVPLILI